MVCERGAGARYENLLVKVAFVYAGGRLGRVAQGPSDFFYGARELAHRSGWDLRLVETDARPADKLTGLLAGRLLRRLVPPRTTADWISRGRRVLRQLHGCDVVVATSTELSFGLAWWKTMSRLPQPLVGILCGTVNYPIGSELRRRLTAKLLTVMQPVLFADPEKAELSTRFGLADEKIAVGWFGVDEHFWSPPTTPVDRSGVLAVGNDGRRDYETLVAAARQLPDLSFTVVTKREAPAALPPNVTWRRGDWREQAVSDIDLRSLYHSAACVVVPLLESPQPSGQSVAMQAMMCGAPVVHTKTAGWWGARILRDDEHVELVRAQDTSALAAAIVKVAATGRAGLGARDALLAARWTSSGFAERISTLIKASARARTEILN